MRCPHFDSYHGYGSMPVHNIMYVNCKWLGLSFPCVCSKRFG